MSRIEKSAAIWSIGLAVALAAGGALMLWAWPIRFAAKTARSSSPIGPVSNKFSLVISGDTAGWIVPCGCTSNQSGGLLRRGTFVAEQRSRGEVVVADAGGAPAGVSLYDRLKFEAILRGEVEMGVCAHNLGGPELALGIDYLRNVSGETGITFLSANARDGGGQLIADEFRIVTAGGRRMLLIGVVSEKFSTPECKLLEPREAILSVLSRQASQYDIAVVLAYVPEPELRDLASSLPEVHAVVGGPTGQSIAPVGVGSTWLASATNKGKFVVRFACAASQSAAGWEADVIEMTGEFADDTTQTSNLQEFRRQLGVRDLTAAESGLVHFPADGLPESYRVAGSESCRDCHASDHDGWHATSHARAWQTLIDGHSQMDSYCQQCHTTGFGVPGGFVSAKHSLDRTGVGCESCHGPSEAHVRQPAVKTQFAARDQCRICHDRENSPAFAWDSYWPQIAHGSEMQSKFKANRPSESFRK